METLILRAPAPHVNATDSIQRELRQCGDDQVALSLSAEENYPCSPSWAEIVIPLATLLLSPVADHYIKKAINAFQRWMKPEIDELNLGVTHGRDCIYRDIPLRDRSRAEQEMKAAFFELRMALEHKGEPMYFIEKCTISDNGDLRLVRQIWPIEGGGGSWLVVKKPSDPDYAFWRHEIVEQKSLRVILEADVPGLVREFELKTKSSPN